MKTLLHMGGEKGAIWFQLPTYENMYFINVFVIIILYSYTHAQRCAYSFLCMQLSASHLWTCKDNEKLVRLALASLSILPRGALTSWRIAEPKR